MTAGLAEYRLKAHDAAWGLLSILFALFSLAWPSTGYMRMGGVILPRGFWMALVYAGIAALCLLAPLLDARFGASRPFGFLRTYYPQAFFALVFTDSILLSSQAMGGRSHDAFFAGLDQAVFGFQPAREFAPALGSRPWINELMFGAYFAYFAFMVIALWIPYLKHDRAEAERQIFTVTATVALVSVWYVFFRVQGPKYWLPDLRSAWYDKVEGGIFVGLFKRSLATTTLSGAAFPSTHVILTLTTLGLAYRNDRRFFAVYAPVAALILCATVYIHAHYAVDILGGMLVAAILPPLFYINYWRMELGAAAAGAGFAILDLADSFFLRQGMGDEDNGHRLGNHLFLCAAPRNAAVPFRISRYKI